MQFLLGMLFGAAIGILLGRRMRGEIPSSPEFTIEGSRFMYIVKADETDKNFMVEPGAVKDSEGHVVADAQTTTVVQSSDPAIVEVIPDPADENRGALHFGSPGSALVTAVVTSDANPDVQQVLEASFLVTPGDPANITGGKISVEGLTEAPEPEPAPEP